MAHMGILMATGITAAIPMSTAMATPTSMDKAGHLNKTMPMSMLTLVTVTCISVQVRLGFRCPA
ncbi:hypothetical protein GCM10027399_14180 [Curvibacter fontanus]